VRFNTKLGNREGGEGPLSEIQFATLCEARRLIAAKKRKKISQRTAFRIATNREPELKKIRWKKRFREREEKVRISCESVSGGSRLRRTEGKNDK